MKFKSIVVFCGSKSGVNPQFETEAKQLGLLLAENNVELIYGGGNKGLMGAVANAALEHGGRVTGIIPQQLCDLEHQHTGLTELIIVSSMHERKQLLYEKADAAIVLPGGYGTLDEMFELLTWNQLRIHEKKIFFLNTNGFYNHLLMHLQKMHNEDFLYSHPESQMAELKTPEDLLLFL